MCEYTSCNFSRSTILGVSFLQEAECVPEFVFAKRILDDHGLDALINYFKISSPSDNFPSSTMNVRW